MNLSVAYTECEKAWGGSEEGECALHCWPRSSEMCDGINHSSRVKCISSMVTLWVMGYNIENGETRVLNFKKLEDKILVETLEKGRQIAKKF